MNELQVFQNKEFGEVRTVCENGNTLFCGSDVARALGYINPRDALARHCKGVVKRDGVSKTTNQHGATTDQTTEMSFIPEGDVYRLIIRSTLPSAEKFERWVFDDVIPSIRRTGMYAVPQSLPEALRLAADLAEQIEAQKPLVQFAETCQKSDDTILIREFAKVLCKKGFNIGEKRLYQLLRDWGMIYRQDGRNLPYQKYIDRKYFEVTEAPYIKDGDVCTALTTRITVKGQQFILAKLLTVSLEAHHGD